MTCSRPCITYSIESGREDEERVVAGRGNDSDVLLRHASVSKQHAAFLLDQVGAVSLRDLDSKNGTFVNGKRITDRVEIASGDELRFGRVSALLCDAVALWSTIASATP